jgi:DNA-binding ferritin-like protein
MGINRKDHHNFNLQDEVQQKIEADQKDCLAVLEILNDALADEIVLSIKTRGARWNVQGPGYFIRDSLFGAQYKVLNEISNQISKRSLELNGSLIGCFDEFLKKTRLREWPGMIPGMKDLIVDHESAIQFLRADAKTCSDKYGDKATGSLLLELVGQHEKMVTSLRA